MAPLSAEQLKAIAESYEKNGFAVVENFLSEEEVEEIRRETVQYIRDETKNSDGTLKPGEVWTNPDTNDWYFQSDDAKTRLFYEQYAVDKENNKLKIKHEDALCKMGFALHKHRPFFMNFVQNKKITDVLKAIDYQHPKLIQTMLNFKNPKVGGEFIPHQDTSYLTTDDPRQVVGFWFALDDATVENGCLDVIPQSHKWNLNRKYVRANGGKAKNEEGANMEWTGPMAVYDESMYIKVPCKRGALVLIHGLLLHKSDRNHTDKSRWAFVFHCFDESKCKYVDGGWLKADCPAFVPIYSN